MTSWNPLDLIPPTDLVAARLELHHAAQLVAIGIGRSFLPERSDDSHTNLFWCDGAWWSREIPGSNGLRAGLRPAELDLLLGDERLSLVGKTRQQGLSWLRRGLDEQGLVGERAELDIHYDLPDHPVAEGAAFRGDLEPGRQQLAAWYAAADGVLREMATTYGSSEVVTWPHHFDIATLLTLDAPEETEEKPDEESQRSIGMGLSPGDGNFAQPYFSVTPWPVPEQDPVELPHGFWTRENFFGAILTGEDLLAAGGEPKAQVEHFLKTAIDGGLASLGAQPG